MSEINETEERQHLNWGGKRKGSGRKYAERRRESMTIRVDPDIYDAVVERVEKTGKNLTQVVESLIKTGLGVREAYERSKAKNGK